MAITALCWPTLPRAAYWTFEGGDLNIGYSHQFQGSNLGGLNIAAGAFYHSSDASYQEDWLTGSGTLDNSFNNSLPILYLGVANTTNDSTFGVANNSATFSGYLGAMENYAGNGGVHVNSLAVVKQGSGMQTLSGPGIQYSGSTSVTGGTLALVNLSNYNAYNAASNSNGQYNASGTAINLQNNATLLWNLAPGANVHVNQEGSGATLSLTGTGIWRITGTGTVQVGGQNSPVNVDFAAGSLIDLEGGTFRNEYVAGNWSGNQASMYVAGGATVDLWDSPGGITVDALTGGGTVQHTSYGNIEPLTVGIANGSGTFAGTITDAVAQGNGPQVLYLVKSGAGNETLTGANTYTGSTSVTGGSLQLGTGLFGQDGSIAGTSVVSNNATLIYDLYGNQTASYPIGGNGNLVKLGPGQLTLTGTNTYTGGTFVDGGELVLTNNEAVADGSSLTVGNGSHFSLAVPAADSSASLSAHFNLKDRLTQILVINDRDIPELKAPCLVGPQSSIDGD